MPLQDDFRESPFVPELPSPPAAQSGPDVTLDLGTTGWGGTQAGRGVIQLLQYEAGVPQRCKISPCALLSPVLQTDVKLLFVPVGSGTVLFSSENSSEFLGAEFG